jgi:hypothetical protein
MVFYCYVSLHRGIKGAMFTVQPYTAPLLYTSTEHFQKYHIFYAKSKYRNLSILLYERINFKKILDIVKQLLKNKC